MSDDPWLTVEQIAERLQMHPDTIRRFLREGRLHGYRMTRRAGWRVRASEVDRFVTGDLGGDEGHGPKGQDES
jgi:excisionase family DNA binding protein